jgi:hypothetical protein
VSGCGWIIFERNKAHPTPTAFVQSSLTANGKNGQKHRKKRKNTDGKNFKNLLQAFF